MQAGNASDPAAAELTARENDRRVTVTYEALPNLDTFERIRDDLVGRLPLRLLSWKPITRTVRTIESLHVDFKAYKTVAAQQRASFDILDSSRPYLHLLFVNCEDSDVYRATTRQQIRLWLDSIAARQHTVNVEWLIVHVTSSKTSGSSAKFYQRKSTISDKIRADFNTPKRDRCISLNTDVGTDSIAGWLELLQKMKEGIVLSFEANVVAYEEDLRKLDSQRTLPGWNFCTFFIQKEGLAFSFEAMNLYEDALIQYDELEASFFQTLKDSNLSWFGTLGGCMQNDAPLSILSYSQKPYRDLIKTNAISLFDFRTYLFARQALLLAKLHRVADLAKRGQKLIIALSALLRAEQNMDAAIIQSWIYHACLELLNHTSDLAEALKIQSLPMNYHLTTAETAELARRQLDQLGIIANYLPNDYPFTLSAHDMPSVTRRRPNVSDSDDEDDTRSQMEKRKSVVTTSQLPVLESPKAFNEAYLDICSRCQDAYTKANRSRAISSLALCKAAFDERLEHIEMAQHAFVKLPPNYFDTGWKLIESAILFRCIQLQQKLDMPREYLLSLMALLRSAWVERLNDFAGLLKPSAIFEEMRRASSTLDKDFAVVAFPAFQLTALQPNLASSISTEGIQAQFSINNKLPVTVAADEIRLKFCTAQGDFLWFSTKDVPLSSGANNCEAFCPSPFSGRLLLEVLQIRLARVIFQYHFREAADRGQPWLTKALPGDAILGASRRSIFSVTANIISPDKVAIDKNRSCIIRLWTGREPIKRMDIQLHDSNDRAVFDYQSATCSAEQVLKDSNTSVRLEGLPANAFQDITLPFTCSGGQRDIPVDLNLKWTCDKESGLLRTLRLAQIVPYSLPFSIDIQDHFRTTKIITRTRITPAANSAILVNAAKLHFSEGYRVLEARKPADYPLVTSGKSLASLFAVEMTDTGVEDTERPRLQLSYCTLLASYTESLKAAIRTALDQYGLEYPPPFVDDIARRWSKVLIKQTQLAVPLTSQTVLKCLDVALNARNLQHVYSDVHQPDLFLQALQAVAENFRSMDQTPWQSLDLPCDLPSIQILVTASLRVPAQHRMSVGQAINAVLNISTSFKWAGSARESLVKSGHNMMYEMQADKAHWAVSGRVSGEFRAEDEGQIAVDFILIPLRSGSLPLPRLSARPLVAQQEDGLSEEEMLKQLPTSEVHFVNSAQRVEVLPKHIKSTYIVPLR